MDKEIKYSGVAANLPGYKCPDGEFEVAMDLWPENGSYKPVLPPQEVMTLASGQKVVYLHKTNGNSTKYIIYEAGQRETYKLYWSTNGTISSSNLLMTFTDEAMYQGVTAIGNTLVVSTDEGLYYFLWKNSSYTNLGTDIPEIQLSFGLQGRSWDRTSGMYTLSTAQSISEMLDDGFEEENISLVTNAVMAQVNKHIAERVTNKGKFMFPFFVRYAYRLFDGSLTLHSAPILMCPSNKCLPLTKFQASAGSGTEISNFYIYTYGISCQLDYIVASAASIVSDLSNWKDVVKSVDVFISAPLYTIDQATSKIKKLKTFDTTAAGCMGYGLFKLQDPDSSHSSMGTHYMCHDIYKLFNDYADVDNKLSSWATNYFFDVDTKNVEEDIPDVSTFYLLKSLKIEDLATSSRTTIDVAEDYLGSLVNREAMNDDYDSHDKLIPSGSFVYNSRLNIYGLTKNLYGGYGTASMFAYASGYTDIDGAADVARTLKMLIKVQQDGKTHVLSNITGTVHKNQFLPVLWFYYPNTNGVSVQMQYYLNDSLDAAYDIALANHSFLNGSYFQQLNYTTPSSSASSWSLANGSISLPNKLYTSEVNNPFYFPVTNINTIGVGEIIDVSAAAKPLSLGQFGQFPLYAFSTDGIWALSVNDTGGYSAKQPISMEVAKAGTICQLDSSVVFATDRGLMLISGSNVTCISETIDGRSDGVFVINNTNLPSSQAVLSSDVARLASVVSFRTFLANAKCIYDNVSQRIIVYNPSYTYAYIFAMDGTKQWGMMRSTIASSVNSYPNAMAMTSDNKLVDFSVRGTNANPPTLYQLAVTRPLKMDLPDVMKRVTSVIQRGNFYKHTDDATTPNPVQCVLYGSRNLNNWFPIWSSTDEYLRGFSGTPYKYFRILLKCWLRDTESIDGCSVQFTPEMTNQPR